MNLKCWFRYENWLYIIVSSLVFTSQQKIIFLVKCTCKHTPTPFVVGLAGSCLCWELLLVCRSALGVSSYVVEPADETEPALAIVIREALLDGRILARNSWNHHTRYLLSFKSEQNILIKKAHKNISTESQLLFFTFFKLSDNNTFCWAYHNQFRTIKIILKTCISRNA